ncbi:hypothetical protein [Mesorhizobium comanense]|uniref:hypothetical protein n=1 Tax=Mesorhizobium comanense TaxID=2502215 RepID=UPI0010F600E4|nr:hypothetical protein [Mesorhizobium comanense]
MKKLILALLLGAVCPPPVMAGSQKDIIDTRFGPLVTQTHDVDLLTMLKPSTGAAAPVTARIELVWPGEVFGANYSERRQTLKKQASDWGRKECEILLKTLASECQLDSATADSWMTSAILVLNLTFVPTEAFPAAKATEARRLKPLDLVYDNDAKSPAADVEAAAAERSRIYAQMRRDCRETRNTFGNCMLYRIRIDSYLLGKATDLRIRSTGSAQIAAIWQQREFK